MDEKTKVEKNKGGSPDKLTPERQEIIVKLLRFCNYRITACRAAGITYETFLNWMKRGKKEKKGKYFEFFCAVEKAEAEGEAHAVVEIMQSRNPRVILDLLARKYPDRWGTQGRIEHSGQVELISMTIEERQQRIAELEKRKLLDSGGDDGEAEMEY
jgi:hypothetical protein